MSRRFILFSMPRTGSSMMVHMLSTHPDVVCYPAMFSKANLFEGILESKTPSELKLRLHRIGARWLDHAHRFSEAAAFLDDLSALSPEEHMGFKHHFGPIRNEVTAMLMKLGYRAIVLNRANLLACYASNLLVKVTGQGQLYANQERNPGQALFDPDEFGKFVTRRRTVDAYWRPLLAATGVATLDVEYTQARTLAGMERVAEFLGAAPGQFGEWPTLKRHGDDIVARFVNPDNVKHYLHRHGLEDWSVEA